MITMKKDFLIWNQWQKLENLEEVEELCSKADVEEVWGYLGKESYNVQVRKIPCEFGIVTHLVNAKTEYEDVLKGKLDKTKELSYSEKNWVRENIVPREKGYMIEIFPRETSLVDVADLYHLWILPEDFQFPFSIEYPSERTYEESGYFYDIRFGVKEIKTSYGKLVVISIKSKDGKRIPWKSKQEIKDDLIGKEETAIEIISKIMKEDECYMIGLPHRYHLPFGLAEGSERLC